MKSLGLLALLAAGGVVAFSVSTGCSSDSGGGTTTPDGGGVNIPGTDSGADGATCGKLPPTGPTQVVPASTATDTEDGKDAAFILDSKGRPFIAYITYTTSNTGTLNAVSWDDCAGAWRNPVAVDTNIAEGGTRSLSLSVDKTDGRLAIGYSKKVHLVSPPRQNDTIAAYVATSTDSGVTFPTPAKISDHKAEHDDSTEGDINDVNNVRVALGGGKTYVAYHQTYAACGQSVGGNPPQCRDGSLLATVGTPIAYETVKAANYSDVAPNAATRGGIGLGLALDSANVPALAVHLQAESGSNVELVYWRPGQAVATKITDSDGAQNDDSDVSLAFDGLKPRIITRLQPPSSTADVYFAASTDNGTTWAPKVGLPRPESITYSQNLVIANSKVFTFLGGPHVFESTDLTTFTAADVSAFAQGSGSVTGDVDSSGKFWMAFEGTAPTGNDGKSGVVLYREP